MPPATLMKQNPEIDPQMYKIYIVNYGGSVISLVTVQQFSHKSGIFDISTSPSLPEEHRETKQTVITL